jgi:hypothetical protein
VQKSMKSSNLLLIIAALLFGRSVAQDTSCTGGSAPQDYASCVDACPADGAAYYSHWAHGNCVYACSKQFPNEQEVNLAVASTSLILRMITSSLIIKGTRIALPSALIVMDVDMLNKPVKLSALTNSLRTDRCLTLSKS